LTSRKPIGLRRLATRTTSLTEQNVFHVSKIGKTRERREAKNINETLISFASIVTYSYENFFCFEDKS
jgi:hypothetical protein